MKQFDDLGVSRETIIKLEEYSDLLLKWNSKINLISKKDTENILTRHILDSAQLINYINDKNFLIADLGSGGGLPGIVLSIMGCKNIYLIELDERKAVFLREATRKLNLTCNVLNKDISLVEEKFDVCISRGLGELELLLKLSANIIKENGYCLFLKGQKADNEIAEASKKINFECKKHPSITQENGVILEVRNINIK